MSRVTFARAAVKQVKQIGEAGRRVWMEGIASSFNDPTSFPDLQVKLGGAKSWLCHRLILSNQSPEFAKLIQESTQKDINGVTVIELFGDTPSALAAALRFCYELRVDFLKITASGMSELMFYLHVFTIGEKYSIKDLPSLAGECFAEAFESFKVSHSTQSHEMLVEAIEAVYTTTSNPNNMRKAIINKIVNNSFVLLTSRRLHELAQEVPQFGQELWTAMETDSLRAATPVVNTNFICGKCQAVQKLRDPNFRTSRPNEFQRLQDNLYSGTSSLDCRSCAKEEFKWEKQQDPVQLQEKVERLIVQQLCSA